MVLSDQLVHKNFGSTLFMEKRTHAANINIESRALIRNSRECTMNSVKNSRKIADKLCELTLCSKNLPSISRILVLVFGLSMTFNQVIDGYSRS